MYVFRDIIIQLHFLYNNTRWFNLWFKKECHHSLHNEHFPCFLRNPFWQYQTTEVNNDTLITKTDFFFRIYLFIKHVLFILMSLYKCKMYVSRVETIWESLSFHLITWLPVFNVPQFIAKLVIPPNNRLHRRWWFNEGSPTMMILPFSN